MAGRYHSLEIKVFHLQDSGYSSSYSLHEALLAEAEDAIRGGGAYAFVSVSGTKLYLDDQAFIEILDRDGFKLVVGVDQITNVPTLEKLHGMDVDFEQFEVLAYWNTGSSTIFHPKFSWFRKEEGGSLVLGSGNLTVNGLRKNTEAFVVIDLDAKQIDEIEVEWNAWLDEIEEHLHPVNDAVVLEKASLNQVAARNLRRRGVSPEAGAGGELEVDEDATEQVEEDEEDNGLLEWAFAENAEVLVAEIPRSGNRWNQANFDLDSFENFFGARAGDNTQRILLRSINSAGEFGEIEVRPSVSVVSQNYRFELEAAAGLDYPIDGRPIGVFIKVTTRMFLYVLCMPGQRYHTESERFLVGNWTGRADRMMRIRTTVGALEPACPSLPSWA